VGIPQANTAKAWGRAQHSWKPNAGRAGNANTNGRLGAALGISKHVTNTQGKQSALGSLPATRLDPKFTI